MPLPDLAGLLFASKPSMEFRGAPLAIPLDAVLDRSHAYASRVTEAPIEDRATVSDHVILEPRRLTVHGLVSDHAISIGGALSALASTVTSLFGEGPTATRSRQAMDALKEAWKKRSLMTVVTRLETYENMVIEKLDVTEGPATVEALEFTVELREIERVKLATATVGGRLSAAPGLDAAAGAVDRGRKAGAVAPPSARTLNDTLARIGQ